MERLDAVVRRLWQRLLRGDKVDVPAWSVEHLSRRPDLFTEPPVAWPMGQTCDYVWPLQDGGRVHAQCFEANGVPMIRLHLDRHDPDRSFGEWFRHALRETPAGPFIAVGMAVGVFALVGIGIAGLVKAVRS